MGLPDLMGHIREAWIAPRPTPTFGFCCAPGDLEPPKDSWWSPDCELPTRNMETSAGGVEEGAVAA
jgi:hypothetical protein